MKPTEDGLDAVLFAKRTSWRRRVAACLGNEQSEQSNVFLDGNVEAIERILSREESGPRVVVNIPADALLSFLTGGQYKNAYDRPVVGGTVREPSSTRLEVDRLLGFGSDAKNFYFGAVAVGGTGVRFYGEYCIVLRPERVSKSTALFDRNSYDLVVPPLSEVEDKAHVVRCLRGKWLQDLVDMLTVKILPKLRGLQRLLTAGAISDAVLHDEDFAEVHLRGTFTPKDVEEIRQSPEDEVVQQRIDTRFAAGSLPSPVELLWRSRRELVANELAKHGTPVRVVASSGRGGRWR